MSRMSRMSVIKLHHEMHKGHSRQQFKLDYNSFALLRSLLNAPDGLTFVLHMYGCVSFAQFNIPEFTLHRTLSVGAVQIDVFNHYIPETPIFSIRATPDIFGPTYSVACTE